MTFYTIPRIKQCGINREAKDNIIVNKLVHNAYSLRWNVRKWLVASFFVAAYQNTSLSNAICVARFFSQESGLFSFSVRETPSTQINAQITIKTHVVCQTFYL